MIINVQMSPTRPAYPDSVLKPELLEQRFLFANWAVFDNFGLRETDEFVGEGVRFAGIATVVGEFASDGVAAARRSGARGM